MTAEHSPSAAAMRMGSPFAAGSERPSNPAATWRGDAFDRHPEPVGEGVWKETAAAAAYSARMLAFFAAAAWAWFPVGGIAVSSLGIVMSAMGLSSRLYKSSLVMMVIHTLILCACYMKSLA